MSAPASLSTHDPAGNEEDAQQASTPHLRLIPPPVWVGRALDRAPAMPGQQLLALQFLLPSGLPAIPQIPAIKLTTPGQQGDVSPWAARLAQAVLEVEAAERPVTQLGQWVLPAIYRRLDRRQQLRARQLDPRAPRSRCPEHVRSVHVCHPTPDIAEVSVVTAGSDRSRAMALRLERRKGRWMCTALDWA
ncbi:MAG: Rv3235 family protein [Actinomycetia bacterium]|nr:Rv3235 family protein [Actinomycetes bacterium]